MPIRFHCGDCRAKIKVPEGAEGRKVKCPRCGAVHRVPEQVQEKQPVAAAVAEHESAFDVQEPQDVSDLDSLASAADDEDYSDSPGDELSSEDEQYEEDEAGDEDEPEVYDPTLINLPEEGEDQNEEDPLAALAAMTDDEGEQEGPDIAFSQDLEPDAEQEEDRGALFEEPDAEEPELSPSALSSVGAASNRAIPIPMAKPRPIPEPAPGQRSEPEPDARPNVPSPQPRGIPLSNKPSTGRPTAKPIPKGEPVPHIAPTQSAVALHKNKDVSSFSLLGPLGWALRVLAVLAVGQTLKLVVTAIMEEWPLGDSLLLVLVGLMATVTVWTVGEIAFAVHRFTR